jgi:hypothetical protein
LGISLVFFGASCYTAIYGRIIMSEHIMHKKETKKAPQKTLKEKREEKKNKKKGTPAGNS